MNRFAREEVEKRLDIADVIGRIVPLNGEGDELSGCCPFCSEPAETNDYLYVNRQEKRFHCNKCEAHGGMFDFVRHYRCVSPDDALDLLRNMYHLPVSLSPHDPEKEALFDVMEKATMAYHIALLSDQGLSSPYGYLRDRGLNDISLIKYKLGFAPNEWQFLFNQLRENDGISEETIEQAGLSILSSENRWYDRFRGRIIIPLINEANRVIGFTARVFGDGRENEPKYINSPETPIFKKSKFLYGLNVASPFIREERKGVIMEGNIDVILAHQNRELTAVAPGSTALTTDHSNMLNGKFPNAEWSLCFDGDSAGQKAAVRTAGKMLGRLNCSIVTLPEGKDPADLYKEGVSLNQYFKSGVPMFDFYMEKKSAGKKLNTLEEKLTFLREISEDFKAIPAQAQGLYLDALSQKINASESSLRQALQMRDPSQRRNGYSEKQFWEVHFLKQLLADGPQEGTLLYFSEALGLNSSSFSMPETSLVYEFLTTRAGLGESSWLPFAGTKLFGLRELREYANINGRVVDEQSLAKIFDTETLYQQKPSLSSLENSLLMMEACSLPGKIDRMYKSGVKFNPLYDQIKKIGKNEEH